MRTTLERRLRAKTEVDPLTGCWTWTGSTRPDGSGQIRSDVDDDGRSTLLSVARAGYELLVGPIPTDQVLSPTCETEHCSNPDHLEPVTRRQLVLRGDSPAARNARRSTCAEGHPLAPDPRPGRSGHRTCPTCRPPRGTRPAIALTCEVCGGTFEASKRTARTCSSSCRAKKSRAARAAEHDG